MTNRNKNYFLLLGQSNMYGCGTIDKQDINTNNHIQVYRNGSWETAQQPLQKWECKIYPEGGGSLGISFARKLHEQYPDSQINLIPCAVSGSPIEKWLPGGECLIAAIKIAKQAVGDGELRAVLWHQGENNSREKDNAKQYFSHFKKVVDALRKEFDNENLPIIVGQLGDFIINNKEHQYSEIVNDALQQACNQIPNVVFVSSTGLTDKDRDDQLHFDMKSLNEFGKRYAEKYVQLSAK